MRIQMPLWIKIHEEDDVIQCLAMLQGRQAPPDDFVLQISYWLGYADHSPEWFLENKGDEGELLDEQWRRDANHQIGLKGDANIKRLLSSLRNCQLPLHIKLLYANIHEKECLQVIHALQANRHVVGISIFGNPGNHSSTVEQALIRLRLTTKAPLKVFNNRALTQAQEEERIKYQNQTRCCIVF